MLIENVVWLLKVGRKIKKLARITRVIQLWRENMEKLLSIHRATVPLRTLLSSKTLAYTRNPMKMPAKGGHGQNRGRNRRLRFFQVHCAPERAAVILDFFLQQHDGVNQLFWSRRATGNIDVHRNPLVNALHQRVIVEHAARGSACTHRNDPLRLRHLHVESADDWHHLLGNAAG